MQAIGWICTQLPLMDLVGDNFDQILVNTAIYGAVWTCITTFLAVIIPNTYSGQGIMIANVYSFLFSGVVFNYELVYDFFKGLSISTQKLFSFILFVILLHLI